MDRNNMLFSRNYRSWTLEKGLLEVVYLLLIYRVFIYSFPLVP
jgi:hypothetical protein